MRLHFIFELESEKITIDYRRKLISYIKFCMKESNPQLYADLYGIGKNTNKDFTMSLYFIPNTSMRKDYILVGSKKMVLNFSTPDSCLGIEIYNALCEKKFEWYPFGENKIRLTSIQNHKEKIITEKSAIFQALSPIVIRNHNKETKKDWFYTFEDDEAIVILKRNLQSELKDKFNRDISYDIEKLQITFLQMKKIIVKSYEFKIPTSIGIFKMEGEPYLLQYLYQRGIGGKRNLAFGYLELL